MRITFEHQRFEGERVIQTSPEMQNRISSEWYSRPKLYTGRALTADTLISNTKHHLRHMQLFGRHLSCGVIEGLTLSAYLRSGAEGQKDEQWLRLTSGLGITAWGEDVTLPEMSDIVLDYVAVWESKNPPRGTGIFVLQPIEILDEAVADEQSQCPWDEDRDAFEDEQIVDGCRLVFLPWPADVLGPVPSAQSKSFRNQLAYRIFDYEKAHPDTPLPWESIGVALGLACIDLETGNVLFLDRGAVVRKGGAPLSTKTTLSRNGTPFLWEARIQQFVGHLHDIRQKNETMPSAHAHFDVLPPVGVLPRQALNIDKMSTEFFPSQFIIDAAPIPEEQLEAAMNASAGLAPFDLHQPEKIKLLAPVPQSVYEPDLLKKEEPDPIFPETLRKLVREIRQWLETRAYLRSMAGRVMGAIDKAQIPAFDDDTDKIPDEEKFPAILSRHEGISEFGLIATNAAQSLHDWIKKYAPGVSDAVIRPLAPVAGNPPQFPASFAGLEIFMLALKNNIQKTEDILNAGYVKAETDMYRLRQVLLGNEKSSRMATSPAMGQIVSGQTSQPSTGDVETYFKAAAKAGAEKAAEASKAADAAEPDNTEKIVPERRTLFSKRLTLERSKPLVERIYESPSVEVKSNAVKTKSDILDTMADIPLELDDEVEVVGSGKAIMKEDEYNAALETLGDDANSRQVMEGRAVKSGSWVILSTTGLTDVEKEKLGAQKQKVDDILTEKSGRKGVPLSTLKTDASLGKNIRDGLLDPDPDDGDEADYFSAGVTSLEHALNAMRAVEKRLADYKKALQQSQKTLLALEANASRWKDKLGEADDKLMALRHDALVTRSLFEEEKSRLAAINERRRAIIDAYVTSLVFVRPRLVDARLDVPSVPLYAEYANPVPACLAEDFEAEGELAEMLDVFREVPLAWLTDAKGLVKLVNEPSVLVDVMKQSKNRTYKILSESVAAETKSYKTYNTHAYGKAMGKIVSANRQYRQDMAKQKTASDLTGLNAKTWAQLADSAESQVSLADLMEKGKGFSKLAVSAAEIMENLEDVAVSLYHLCNELEPAVKLQWANLMSIYDKPVDLRHLETLPSFDKLDFIFRRDLQNMVDWLFSQVDVAVDRARETMNDLVRVCILLAGHAPVSAIVKGYVGAPSTGKVGDFIDITVNQGKIKVGMLATVFTGQAMAVQGVVTDVGENATRVQVTQASGGAADFNIDKGAQVKFASGKYSKSRY